jgi:hypothetical protein
MEWLVMEVQQAWAFEAAIAYRIDAKVKWRVLETEFVVPGTAFRLSPDEVSAED